MRTRTDSGAILVWVAVMTVALLAIAALAVDLGYGYAVKRQLSATADASALAGAQEAGLKFLTPTVNGCGTNLETVVKTAVFKTYNDNAPAGSQGDPDVDVTCFDDAGNEVTSGTGATSVEVRVDNRSTLKTFFGRVLGVSTLSPASTATASVTGSSQLRGLRPFLVCREDAAAAKAAYQGGATPLYQSFYQKGGKNEVAASGQPFVGATWDSSKDEVSRAQDAQPYNDGNYVRLVNVNATGTGVGEGFYYVRDAKQKTFKLSLTKNGPAVDVTTTGTVDVYKQARDLEATWSGTTLTTTTAQDLAIDTDVWVQVTSGSGIADGPYQVSSATPATPVTTLQLSNTSGVVTASSAVSVNLYVLATPGGSTGQCSPPSASGNWGYSRFDLTSGPNFQLACLIKYGYGGGAGSGKPDGTECLDPTPNDPGVDVGDPSTGGVTPGGDPGNNLGPIQDGPLIRALIDSGETILLPVGSGWVQSANGSNAQYNGYGAVAVKLCGYAFPGNQVGPATPQPPGYPDSWFGGCGSQAQYEASVVAGDVTKDTTLVIQWRYAEWVGGPQGNGSGTRCPLDRCLGQLQLIK